MKTKGKYRRGTSYRVSFPTAPSIKAQPSRVDLYQEKYSHEILVLEFTRSSSLWFNVLKTGTPVVFSWERDGVGRQWVGYVNYLSKQSASQKQRTMKVVCVGATYLLKQKAARVFRNKTITEAAAQIAKEFGFAFIAEPSSRKFETLAISGESYWEWLNKQAQRIGYGILAVNCTLIMRPLDKLIDAASSNAPVFSMEPPGPVSGTKFLDRTLDSLTVLNGEYVEGADMSFKSFRVTAGVNPVTGALTGSVANPAATGRQLRSDVAPTIFRDFSDEVVHSQVSAKQAARGEAEASRLGIPAEAIGQGDHRVRPFATVFVEGTGETTDGYWVVASAHHSFKLAGDYQITMKMYADGLGPSPASQFRRTDGGRLGTLNLNEAVLRPLSSSTAVSSIRLITRVPIIVETQQGFTRLGSVWSGR